MWLCAWCADSDFADPILRDWELVNAKEFNLTQQQVQKLITQLDAYLLRSGGKQKLRFLRTVGGRGATTEHTYFSNVIVRPNSGWTPSELFQAMIAQDEDGDQPLDVTEAPGWKCASVFRVWGHLFWSNISGNQWE